MAFFAIPALVGGTFQIVYSVPGLCVGIMISMLLLYIICQEQLISTDPLTGLNNRNRFETYMLSLFSNVDQAEDVYLLMMVLQKAVAEQDIMHLCATINDELAHAEVPYALRMSIGYARVGDSVDTWQDLLRAADAELYRVKAEKKKAGAQIR